MRLDLCNADDYDTRDRLVAALAALGAVGESDHESALGIGLNRFRVGEELATVFIDAWVVDLEGPERLVKRLLDMMTEVD